MIPSTPPGVVPEFVAELELMAKERPTKKNAATLILISAYREVVRERNGVSKLHNAALDLLVKREHQLTATERERDEAQAQVAALRRIEDAARALKFSGYPAHGSGFVIRVTGGNVSDLEAALTAIREQSNG